MVHLSNIEQLNNIEEQKCDYVYKSFIYIRLKAWNSKWPFSRAVGMEVFLKTKEFVGWEGVAISY